MSERSNLSYTNKDFNSIYVELLEYAKKLSYKWDPTESDESDPGVVLLKLAAIIGDKDNYNIDKNVLELMPASVTQLSAARQIFDQCGYSMKYYRSARGSINLTIKKELGEIEESNRKKSYSYKIPKFTMFTDSDNTVVYTSTEEIQIPAKTETSIDVIEGVATAYKVNNDPLITLQNLDSNNRLYFSETDIAENGIFITNVYSTNTSKTNYEQWQRVDNLQVQSKGKPCYKFGITVDSSVCYIEFPDDVEFLFGEGVNITYIKTTGSRGNVSRDKIKEFYSDTKFLREDSLGLESIYVDATTENIAIRNILPIVNGQDPESIDDAYIAYKRVRDTFDTLVSIKDYSDYMITAESASNGYVCDRTNDIQNSYKIQVSDQDSSYPKTVTSDMNAFNLCVYALQYVPVVTSDSTYKSTFKLTDGKEAISSFNNDEVKSLQHDFLEFKTDTILMLKNKYPIHANIVPKYTLSETEKNQLIYNVETALCRELNSKRLSFGASIPIDLVQDTIFNADERIKNIIDFSSLNYETYAVFKYHNKLTDQFEFKELRIDSDSHDGGFVETKLTKSKFNAISTHELDPKYKNLYYKTPTNTIEQVRSEDVFDPDVIYYTWDNELSNLWHKFRVDIFAKNILSGVTPLYKHEDTYSYGVAQSNITEYEDIHSITTNTDIVMTKQADSNTWISESLRENESVLLSSPNFVQENNFSSYIKIIYSLGSNLSNINVPSDSRYQLENDDFIIFFWKAADSDIDYTYIKYDSSENSLARFITPSGFYLPKKQPDIPDDVLSHFRNMPAGRGKTHSSIYVTSTETESQYVSSLNSTAKYHVLTGTRIIKTENINQIHINNNINGCGNIYWFLNDINSAGRFELFDASSTTYVLKSGEYFVYTNDEKTSLHLLGEGTIIERGEGWLKSNNAVWTVEPVSYEDLLTEGIDILADKWMRIKKIDKSSTGSAEMGLWATEQQQILIGPNNKFSVTGEIESDSTFVIDNQGVVLDNLSISYTDSEGNTVNIESIDSSDAAWTARSILNINISSTTPQKLYEHQSFTLKSEDTTYTPTLKGNNDSPLFILSNKSISRVGGIDLDVTDDYSKNSTNILSYNVVKNDNYTYISDTFETSLSLTSGKNEVILSKFKLLQGSYLLNVYTSKKISALEVSANLPSDLFEISPLLNNSSVVKVYKLVVKKESTEDFIDLKISYSSDVDFNLIFNPLYKFNTSNLRAISDTFEEQLLERLSQLDVNNEFDYSYEPSNPIVNPLDSEKFLTNTHFYNPYTICEWNADVAGNIVVHDVTR